MFVGPAFFGGKIPVDVLMHMGGLNNGTIFREEGGKVVTRAGSGIITSTAHARFGTASATGFAPGNSLAVHHSEIAGDFTLAVWSLFLVNPSDSNRAFAAINEDIELYLYTGTNPAVWWGNKRVIDGPGFPYPSPGTWALNVLERVGGVVTSSVNGAVVGSAHGLSRVIPAGILTIGSWDSGGDEAFVGGYIDEVYLNTSKAIFGGMQFTPPTAPF